MKLKEWINKAVSFNKPKEAAICLVSILCTFVFHEYAQYVYDFYDASFWIITLVASIPFFLFSLNILRKFALQLDYISVTWRMGSILFLGLFVNVIFISGIKLFNIYRQAGPMPTQPIIIPVTGLGKGRKWKQHVYFDFNHAKRTLNISLAMYKKIEENGVDRCCVLLYLLKSNNYFILDHYTVKECFN